MALFPDKPNCSSDGKVRNVTLMKCNLVAIVAFVFTQFLNFYVDLYNLMIHYGTWEYDVVHERDI